VLPFLASNIPSCALRKEGGTKETAPPFSGLEDLGGLLLGPGDQKRFRAGLPPVAVGIVAAMTPF
jgi:hypothetical protein